MIIDWQTIWIVSIIFYSSLVNATLGFGFGLLSMPLLALLIDIKTASPLVGMVGTTVVFCILVKHWRKVHFKDAKCLIFAAIFGIPIGLFFLRGMNENILKIFLGLIVFSFSIYMLNTRKDFHLKTEKASYIFGFFSGILSAAYNTGGPPVIIYGTLRRWTPDVFRATLQGFFFPLSIFVIAGHYSIGLWTPKVIHLYLLCLPFVILSVNLGNFFNRSLRDKNFNRYVHILLIFIGIMLLVQSIKGFFTPEMLVNPHFFRSLHK